MMTKDTYPALFHFIHKAMAPVRFPAKKAEVLAMVGDTQVHVDWEKVVPLKTFIEPIPQSVFSCAADFYCAMIASMG